MASVFNRKRDRQRKNSAWYIVYLDENGKRITVKGCADKSATKAISRKLESEAELRRRGAIDPKTDKYRAHEAIALADHLEAWRVYLLGRTDDVSGPLLDSALTAPGQRGEVGAIRNQSVPDVIADSHASLLTIHGSLENKRPAGIKRTTSVPVGYNSSSGSVSVAGARPGLQNR